MEAVGLLIAAQFMAAVICVTLALGHLFVWLRRYDKTTHLWFALSALASGGTAVAEAHFYTADTIEAFSTAFRWANSLSVVALLCLFWFFVTYSDRGTRWRGVKNVISAVFALAVLVNHLLPYGFLYQEITSLRSVVLPWGEVISLPVGRANPWRPVVDIAFLGMMIVGADNTRTLWQQSRRRGAMLIGGSFLLYLSLLLVSGLVTDFGVAPIPYLFTWAYLLVGLAMSYELAGEVVRAADLSEEVKSNERRWRSLLENVQLLVAGADPDGRINYVNPHFINVTGYDANIVGRPFVDLLPEGEREGALRDFRSDMKGNIDEPHVERQVVTKRGDVRRVRWSRVLLRDKRGKPTGILGIGADVTEQRAAEKSRDEALIKTRKALADVEELKRRLEDEVVYLEEEITNFGHFDEIVGESDVLRYVLGKVEQVAPLDTTILIEGETGVGKELFARAIHRLSPRGRRPLVKVNCASLPETLVEDELFGHERGAFTGAVRLRKGRFELADNGTIFLDEVGELPLSLQSKLLRVLQEGEFERVGGDQTLKVDVRVIAATNRNLKEEVQAGRFRSDLFYRLNVYPITVPALRQRRGDIPLLAGAFVKRYAQAQGKQIDTIPSAVVDELRRYDWPGNVRELENVIQRAVITSPDHMLRLGASLAFSDPGPETASHNGLRVLSEVDRAHILEILEQCEWRIGGEQGAAKQLGLHPNTLRFRMKKLGIERGAIHGESPRQLGSMDFMKADLSYPTPAVPDSTTSDGHGHRELAEIERAHIVKVLEQCRWRIEGPRGAAKQLGLHPNTLRFRMKKLEIIRPS